MKLLGRQNISRLPRFGFTLVELMVVSAAGMVVLGGVMVFANFALAAVSGITTQSTINQQGGRVLEMIQSRAILATSVTTSSAGNVLTLGFDDNFKVDSNNDGKTYNDKDHFERFQFSGVNSTNSAACSSNRLIYIPNINSANNRILIPRGVRNLPGKKLFQVVNNNTVVIRLGIADVYAGDRYQAIDLQGTAVALNRPADTNKFIAITP